MGIFGGEKYSRKDYEMAEKDWKEKEDIEKETFKYTGSYKWAIRLTHKNTVEAKKRLEELYGKGQAEATVLNEEYDRLFARAKEAIKAVADFEREKLGMHKEGAEEAEADADKK